MGKDGRKKGEYRESGWTGEIKPEDIEKSEERREDNQNFVI